MARVKASSDQTPMPVFGSGVILVPKMAPNGVFSRYPPANGCPPGWVWHDAQCPAAERASPLATSSGEKVDGLGGSIGAIEGRHAKSNKPANMKQAVTSIVIEMRRIIVVFSNRPRSFFESSSLITHLYRSPKFLPILSVSSSFRRRTFRGYSVFFLNRNCRPEKSWNDGRPIPS